MAWIRLNRGWRQNRNPEDGGVDPYLFPLDGATEWWMFNELSGDLVSDLLVQTYTKADPNNRISYNVASPVASIIGIEHTNVGSDGYFRLLSQPSSVFDLTAAENFTIIVQLKPNNTNSDSRLVLDFGTNYWAASGIYVGTSGKRIEALLKTGATTHLTRGSTNLTDGVFYTIRFVFDRANTKVRIFIKPEGLSEFEETTSQIFSALSSTSSLTLSSQPFAWYRASNNTGSPWWGTIYQAAFAKGTTYNYVLAP